MMVLVLSLTALAVGIGLVVRHGFRDIDRSVEDARRDRLVRAAEREMARLSGDRTR